LQQLRLVLLLLLLLLWLRLLSRPPSSVL